MTSLWLEARDAVERCIRNEETGKMFLVTLNGYSASLGFQQGSIVSAQYRITRGYAAVAVLVKQGLKSFSFDARANVKPDEPALPPTPELLALLGLEEAEVVASPTKSRSRVISQQVYLALESILADFVGPMATVLVEDALSEEPDLSQAISRLSEHISDVNSRGKFLSLAAKVKDGVSSELE